MATELQDYFADQMENPAFRDAYEDAEEIDSLIDALVELRKRSGLTQTDVAKRMSVKQPTVSGFENQDSDPRVSTLQRFARAVGARVCLELETKSHTGSWDQAARSGRWMRGAEVVARPSTIQKRKTDGGAVVIYGAFGGGDKEVYSTSERLGIGAA